ncbi:MAG: hypothetical protein DWQ47_14440 [Acidobacteria bacterium]|nr:MAG: hypothetical protein DWQ32_01840 [Acidobacteriota bacterium]REK02733.1 MAG: hypothetical protein DWQ38_10295 [Acidobacteriota bacterium]REK13462.1 MAG: hypothetical protein DWQ43_07530 [Acidobacteriota bacterium]REK41456.1 MAG: hypothetical protein DWQ47_14440 [Acidobacteriota bacterium]
MMKPILLILPILLLLSSANAQSECAVSEPPSFLNLRLGMTVSEVNSMTRPELKVKAKSDGERIFFKNWINKPAKGNMTGVRAVYLRFFEGRLYDIELFYEEGFRWPDLESLLSEVNRSSILTRENWNVKNGYAEADCEGFAVKADQVLGTHIQLTDMGLFAQVEKSRRSN